MLLLDRQGWRAGPAVALVPYVEFDPAGDARAVLITNTVPAAELLAVQDRLDLIAIEFPKFSDGRGFSIARALRTQGYRGTLRATGYLIPDQFAFALECGFDEVEIGEEQAARQPIEQWLEALTFITASYRPVRRRTA
ncbi:DUF934 domain-containing protein [Sphingosinicella sp. LHD-64]|uniref:DUF934 domain-containing protein n=1 Tax=Sphingosinicella sp. LHD-64 TaxID=3072139 RepID=UPI0028104711|nr:DUF934 domain-containing protein [Sphingosinicella sp. LHD-64]MDQ8757201.1 DUF934 domain-containing protein [Sphingosinicella sp. LHD-64]